MKKLILRDACYNGVDNVKRYELKLPEQHKDLVEEANQKIEKGRERYAAAYKNAMTYLGNDGLFLF